MYKKNNFSISGISFTNKMIQSLIIYSCMTFFFVLLKNTVSPVFGVIKDVIIVISIVVLVFTGVTIRKKHLGIAAIFLFLLSFSWYTSLIYSDNLFEYFYQFKIDFFYILSLIVFFMLFKRISDNDVDFYLRLIVYLSFINAIVGIVQRLFMFKFLGIVGFENLDINNIPALGNVNGLVLQTQNGLFRSIGTMSTPMASAELSLIGMFIFIYYKYKFSIKNLLILLVFVFSIYFTGYKTVYLSAFVILISFFIYSFRLVIIKLSGIVLLIFGFFSVNTDVVYNIFKNISPLYAEYSIRLRYEFVSRVFKSYIENFPFGLYAQNGNYLEVKSNSVPLDSLYIYILSNYGLVGIVVSLIMIFLSYFNIEKINICLDGKVIPVGQYVFVFLASNYFFNQPFVNFPSGWLALVILMLAMMQREDGKKYVFH